MESTTTETARKIPIQGVDEVSPRDRYRDVHVVAIIPAYNEAKNVADVIARTLKYVDEVIVIDDGSSDGTGKVAAEAGAVVLDNIVNRGLGRSMRRGYQVALDRGAEIVVQLDADGQYDPAQIPLLVQPILDRTADMVLGARMENLHYDMPFIKKVGNKAFSAVLRRISKQDVADGQTGFRAIRREVLETCIPINKFSYTQEMILRAAAEGWRIKSVQTDFHARYDGKSRLMRSPLQFAIRQWTIILRTMRDHYPMKFFGIPGIISLVIGMAFLSWVAVHYVTTGRFQGTEGSALAGSLATIVGLQLVIVGLVADMIRTHTKF